MSIHKKGGKPPPEGYVQQFMRVIDSFLLYRLKGVKRTVPPKTTGLDDLNMDDAVVKTLDPEAAKDYSEMMENADYTIVIHCTHGVNRSGTVFLIFRRMKNISRICYLSISDGQNGAERRRSDPASRRLARASHVQIQKRSFGQ